MSSGRGGLRCAGSSPGRAYCLLGDVRFGHSDRVRRSRDGGRFRRRAGSRGGPTGRRADGRVESSPPKTTKSPDGWTLTVSARDETQRVIAPLTTAISTREYEVGGIYSGSLLGPEGDEGAQGTLEVGLSDWLRHRYEHVNGVSLTGTMGLSRLGVVGTDIISPLPEGFIPAIGNNIGGGMTVGLKPGLINTVPCRRRSSRATSPGSWLTDSASRSTAAWVSRSSARMHS